MKANKTHTSLKTAKLLEYCGVESEYVFIENAYTQKYKEHFRDYGWRGEVVIEEDGKNEYGTIIIPRHNRTDVYQGSGYPAFTWQEILLEYADKFFGEEYDYIYLNANQIGVSRLPPPMEILVLLQQKKYEEADKYFRERCILINNK